MISTLPMRWGSWWLSVVGMAALLLAPSAKAQEPRAGHAELAGDVRRWLDTETKSLEQLYKHLHEHPELSYEEAETARRLATELHQAGCEVTTRVGGHGVVGVVKNGDGPTLLIRADMDALPIVERTGLPYASQVRTRDRDGRDVGVMHACGHDINMTCLIGAARALVKWKARWQGTILFVGQPAEEVGAGARAMLADGLFTRFPKPDYALALHCDARYATGMVNYREGAMQANVDSVDVLVRGRGGHGAAPHRTIDPVVIAARIVLDLQTIVSREVDPLDAAVVTVGSIHGGTKHNIIPNDVKLQLTVRTTSETTRKHVLAAISRIARSAAESARAPEPEMKVDPTQFTPALVNDPELTRRTVAMLRAVHGADRVLERPMSLGGEDFSQFVRAGIPGCYFFLGTAPPERVAEAQREGGRALALTHGDEYFPVPEPTLRTGVLSMTLAAWNLLGR